MKVVTLIAAWVFIGLMGGMLSTAYGWASLIPIIPVSFVYGLGVGVLGDMVGK